MSDDLQAVVARVEKLERKNRLMKIAWLALLVPACAVGLMEQAAQKSKNIRGGEQLVLRDAEGNVRVWLGVTENSTSLFLKDANEKNRFQVSVSDDFVGLSLFEAEEKVRVSLGVTPDVNGLFLYDPDGTGRARLVVNDEGTHLALYDENEQVRTLLGVEGGVPWVELLDEKEKVIWSAP